MQYNAIMLIRILADNPGATFTRNMDKKFVDTTKELLRSGKDGNVRQMLMETLDAFESTKGYDENLQLLIEMWKKEKEKAYRVYGVSCSIIIHGVACPSETNHTTYILTRPYPSQHRFSSPPPQQYSPYLSHQQSVANQQEYFQRTPHTARLPDPVELANRLEEARTSAKLLEQVVACTPPQEILSNELIKEFSDRCTSASRSIQGYMSATDPAPDNDTMESLIDTNEQLQQSLNHHQRAVLNAKKQLGVGSPGSESVSRPGSVAPGVNEQSRPPQAATSSNSRNEGVQDWLASSSAAVAGGSGSGQGASSSSRGKGKAAATSIDNDWMGDYKYEPISSGPVAGGSSSAAAAGPSRSHTGTPHRDEEDPFRDPVQPDSSASSMRRVQPSTTLNTTNAGNNEERLSFEPYHPGFGGNSASAGRSNNDNNYSYNSSSAYDYRGSGGGSAAGAGAGNTSSSVPEPVTPVSDDGLYGSGDVHRSTGVQR